MAPKEEDPFADPDNDPDSSTDSSVAEDTHEDTHKEIQKSNGQAPPKSNEDTSATQVPQESDLLAVSELDQLNRHRGRSKPSTWRNQHKMHHHLELPLEAIRGSENPVPYFFERRHKASDLADLIKANYHASMTSLTSQQQLCLSVFNNLIDAEGRNFPYSTKHGPLEIEEILTLAFIFFDTMFFCNSMQYMKLDKFITIELVDELRSGWPGQCIHLIPFSFRERVRDGRASGQCRVTIKIKKSNNEDRNTRIAFYIQTLAHQMIHAFLTIFACRLRGCNSRAHNEGLKRHGDAWQDIAFVVEKGAKKFFGLDLDLGREWAYVSELASFPNVSRSADVKEWGFDKKMLHKQASSCLYSSTIGLGGKQTCSVTRFPHHASMAFGPSVAAEVDDVAAEMDGDDGE